MRNKRKFWTFSVTLHPFGTPLFWLPRFLRFHNRWALVWIDVTFVIERN